MLLQNPCFHRLAAFTMAMFGLYVFMRGVNTGEYKILEDGSIMDSSICSLVCFKSAKTILTLKTGFDVYRSISYGISSFFLLLDLLFNSGYLTLPALVLAAGEIVNDFSDFCLAIVLIVFYVGGCPAAAYGLTYLALLLTEVAIWIGTCKFHENCREAKIKDEIAKNQQEEINRRAKAN